VNDPQISRRSFLRTTAAATGAAAFTTLAPSTVLGANERIRFGVIGCGGMGTGHVGGLVGRGAVDNVQVAAVCDVFNKRITRAKGVAAGADGYDDYRKLLERKDIDAVLIATPDHWHGKIAGEAIQAGKHVYCEKPMTHTVEQAIELRNIARRHKQLLQVGPNATASDGYWKAGDAIREGRIGKVTWAQGSYNRNARVCLFNEHQKIDTAAGPDKSGEDFINWDMWLGHKWGLAPKIPWTPEHFFRFRKYFPYNGGVATDLLYHKLAPLLIALAGPNGEYPLRVNANGGQYIEKDGREIPDTFLMTVDYPSEHTVFLVSTLTNDTQIPDRVYGKFGTMDVGGEPRLIANGEMAVEFKEKNGGQTEARLALQPRKDMVGNFVAAIRGDETLNCNVELGCATMVAIKMAVESYRRKKTMVWDAKREKMLEG